MKYLLLIHTEGPKGPVTHCYDIEATNMPSAIKEAKCVWDDEYAWCIDGDIGVFDAEDEVIDMTLVRVAEETKLPSGKWFQQALNASTKKRKAQRIEELRDELRELEAE